MDPNPGWDHLGDPSDAEKLVISQIPQHSQDPKFGPADYSLINYPGLLMTWLHPRFLEVRVSLIQLYIPKILTGRETRGWSRNRWVNGLKRNKWVRFPPWSGRLVILNPLPDLQVRRSR